MNIFKMTASLSSLNHVMCSKLNLLKSVHKINSFNRTINDICVNRLSNKLNGNYCNQILIKRELCMSMRLCGTSGVHKTGVTGRPILSKQQAEELTLKLTNEERELLLTAIQEYQSKLIKDEYLGQLAANRWRSKFGRPSKLPSLGDVDPTGSFCPVPEDWLKNKFAQSVTPPTTKELVGICVANSIPFIGFGFLDNFLMILAGDYIDITLGSYLCISTMAAAALGNTFSDLMGIGSAYYVERFANYVGYQPPKLTPIQLDMPLSRWFANIGRAVGVTLGCLLGMFPLMFISSHEDKNKDKNKNVENQSVSTVTTD